MNIFLIKCNKTSFKILNKTWKILKNPEKSWKSWKNHQNQWNKNHSRSLIKHEKSRKILNYENHW